MSRRAGIGLGLAALLAVGFLWGCHRVVPETGGPLPQRGYLWQRDWTPLVAEAVAHAAAKMEGVVLLGAEIQWRGGKARVIHASVDWAAVQKTGKPCALALRVAPFPGPFEGKGEPFLTVSQTAAALLAEAKAHGVEASEFQLDFDCAEAKLTGYRKWLIALRPVVKPARLVITTLPSWLDRRSFAALVAETDGFVLQVHSVPTEKEGGAARLCDPALARKWVGRAAALGRPFSVALPTYGCLAGYGPTGKLLGISMDSVQPAWPGGTRVVEYAPNPDELAGLVAQWRQARPAVMRELIWYRIPVATDARNWRWPTLEAVMAGRRPGHRLDVICEGDGPVDVAVANSGEAVERLDRPVTVTWEDARLVAADALPGWSVQTVRNQAVFSPEPGARLRLPPGARRGIGWLRYDRITSPRGGIANAGPTP